VQTTSLATSECESGCISHQVTHQVVYAVHPVKVLYKFQTIRQNTEVIYPTALIQLKKRNESSTPQKQKGIELNEKKARQNLLKIKKS